jgi:hypothetical protein
MGKIISIVFPWTLNHSRMHFSFYKNLIPLENGVQKAVNRFWDTYGHYIKAPVFPLEIEIWEGSRLIKKGKVLIGIKDEFYPMWL